MLALESIVILYLGGSVLLMKKLYFLKERFLLCKPDYQVLCFCVWGRDRYKKS